MMPRQHMVTPTEIGMVHIYRKPSDKTARWPWPRAFWPGKPFYRELVAQRNGTALSQSPVRC